MKRGWLVCAAACLLAGALVQGQTAPAPKAPMSDEVFKNVQVLKGITVNEFMGTMGVFSAALGMSCEDCHTSSDTGWAAYAADTNPRKRTARRMVAKMIEGPDVIAPFPNAPPIDQVLEKYIRALGGADRLARITSFVATGTSKGYGPE